MIGNEKGNLGEKIACAYLEKNGYHIKERNYISAFGEIDIIAQKDGFIVFAEVKLRKKNSRVSGFESVSFSKQMKIIQTSALYLQEISSDVQPRYDVISQIVEERAKQHITQEELALRVGTQKSNISRLESGTYNPSLGFLIKVAHSLGKEMKIVFE